MADKGPAAPKPPIAHKPLVKATSPAPPPLPAPPTEQEQDAAQHVQEDPVQPPAPSAQVPSPVHPVEILVQPANPHYSGHI